MSTLPDFEGAAMFAKVAWEQCFAPAARALGVSVAVYWVRDDASRTGSMGRCPR